MKKTDIAMVIFIASISTLFAVLISNAMFGSVGDMTASIRTIAPISATVNEPNPEVFNANAINPSVQLEIGTDNGTNGTDEVDETSGDESDEPEETDSETGENTENTSDQPAVE